MVDITAPYVTNVLPPNGAVNVLVNEPVEFDFLDVAEPGTGAALLIGVADYFGQDDLTVQIDGITDTFTTTSAYVAGTPEVYLDGILQDGVTELSPTAGTFQLVAVPLVGSVLYVRYVVPYDVNSVDITTVVITIDGAIAFQNSTWQPGYGGEITPLDYGYNFNVTTHPDFGYLSIIPIQVDGSDIAGNAMAPFIWSFTTAAAASNTHRYPYITAVGPADGTLGVGAFTLVQYTIKTDDLAATSINTATLNMWMNGVQVILNGVNQFPGDFADALTPGLRELLVVLTPLTGLSLDTVYTITVEAEDDLGASGGGTYQFSTGAVGFAVLLERQEPLDCPIDNIPVPLLTDTSISSTETADILSSPTSDWLHRGLRSFDVMEVTSGPDAGRWIVRTPDVNDVRLYHTNNATNVGLTANAYYHQTFADKNPVKLVFSPLIDYHYQKVWGDTDLRYWSGYESDANFPQGFDSLPTSSIYDGISAPASTNGGLFDDQTDRQLSFALACTPATTNTRWDRYSLPLSASIQKTLTNTVTLTNGSATVVVFGTQYRQELHEGAKVSFGTDTTVYTVQSIDLVLSQFVLTSTWQGANLAGQPVNVFIGGTRILQTFEIASMELESQFFVGLTSTVLSPTTEVNDRSGASLFRRVDGTIELRAHLGQTQETVVTDLSLASLQREWLLELELQDEQTLRVSLYDPSDLTYLPATRTVSVTGVLAAYRFTHWTVTTLSPGTLVQNSFVDGKIRFVDVEPGRLSPFVLSGAAVTSGDAKARKPQNVYATRLTNQGWNSLQCSASSNGSAFTSAQTATCFLDTDETITIVESYSIDGGKTVEVGIGTELHREIAKYSRHEGFDVLHLTFKANKRGYWHVVVNGQDTVNGTVIARGVYDVEESSETIDLSADLLGSFGDGIQSLNVVICKEPLIEHHANLYGSASLGCLAYVTRNVSATMTGYSTISCTSTL